MNAHFFVYHHFNHELVRIHIGSCLYCQNGHGLKGRGSTKTGKWSAGFENLESALNFAKSLKMLDTGACKRCMSDVHIE